MLPLVRRLALGLLLVVVVLVTSAESTAAQEGFVYGEQILRYDVALRIEPSGTLEVTETIDYDFGSTPHHGIYRTIPTRVRYDRDNDRVIRLEDVRVSASPGTPSNLEVSKGDITEIRIGDPDRTITGRHVYTIKYAVLGVLTRYDDHDELNWNAIGGEWGVPIDTAAVHVEAPADFTSRNCFAGAGGSRLPCSAIAGTGANAEFTHGLLNPSEFLTVVVGLPRGAVQVQAPLLKERVTLDKAFSRTPATIGGLIGLLVVLLGGVVALVWRSGRDRQFVGSPVDASLGNESGEDTPIPMFQRELIPVEFTPPDGLRPGQVGTLIDGRANPLDVTATIIDLGARGYLTITELPGHGLFRRTDWKLAQQRPPDENVLPYERTLLNALFDDRTEVELSDLKNKFVATLRNVQNQLYRDMVDRGWYRHRADNARALWMAFGIALVVGGVLLTIVLAYHTHAALVGLAVPVAGIALAIAAPWMPQRTGKGTSVRRRTIGFRQYIETAETDRSKFAEQENLFTDYLGYAVVFGATEKWAKAFAGLDDEVPQPGFFISPHPFTAAAFSSSMHSFATSATGTIGAAAHAGGSGGGGFSGGGFGGGGGGSW
jgi:uncharacterized protein (TIGR04222 family)